MAKVNENYLKLKSSYLFSEIARRIRADDALKATVLVAVTGYGQMHDRARASASGFHHHLVKPVDYGELLRVLRAA